MHAQHTKKERSMGACKGAGSEKKRYPLTSGKGKRALITKARKHCNA